MTLARRLVLPNDPDVDYIDIHEATNPMTWQVKMRHAEVACPISHAIASSAQDTSPSKRGSMRLSRLVRMMTPSSMSSTRRRASTQTVQTDSPRGEAEVTLTAFQALARIHEDVYISVQQDQLGQHGYVHAPAAWVAVKASLRGDPYSPLEIIPEEIVKAKVRAGTAVALNALVPAVGSPAVPVPDSPGRQNHAGSTAARIPMCPKQGTPMCNYHCVEELTLGPTQRVLLADESTLHRGNRHVPIFSHISLIVNTHEDASAARKGKYNVGDNPQVIYQPIHKMYSLPEPEVCAIIHSIQESVWQALRSGSVVSHCLAGLHRAPVVVVCHFLYRHYVLRMTDTLADVNVIYSRLQAVRPHVEPLGYIKLIRAYERFLISKHRPK